MLHRRANATQKRKYVVSKKWHGRSFTQAVTFKKQTNNQPNKKNVWERKKMYNNKFLSDVLWAFSGFGWWDTRSGAAKPLAAVVKGSPLRTHTHGSPTEISTMNIVTKYPTSTIDKVRPQPPRPSDQSQESSFRTPMTSANRKMSSTPTWRPSEFRPFIINYSTVQNMQQYHSILK